MVLKLVSCHNILTIRFLVFLFTAKIQVYFNFCITKKKLEYDQFKNKNGTCSFVVIYQKYSFYLFSRLRVAEFDYGKKCQDIAEKTEGLSGREISKLGVAWQVIVF